MQPTLVYNEERKSKDGLRTASSSGKGPNDRAHLFVCAKTVASHSYRSTHTIEIGGPPIKDPPGVYGEHVMHEETVASAGGRCLFGVYFWTVAESPASVTPQFLCGLK